MSKGGWELHTDVAASKEGSGTSLIVKTPRGDEITYSLRFDFQISNNEAEYVELLAGLRLAQEFRSKPKDANIPGKNTEIGTLIQKFRN